MSYKLIYITVGIFLLFGCTSETDEQNDREIAQVHGKVKQVKSELYEAIEKFGEVEKGNRLSSGYLDNEYTKSGIENSTISFTEDGQLIHLVEFDKTGDLQLKLIKNDSVYDMYDPSGDLRFKMIPDSKEKPSEINLYDDEGGLIRMSKLEYNNLGKEKSKFVYSGDGELISKSLFFYDAKGKQVKIEKTDFADRSWKDDEVIEIEILYNDKDFVKGKTITDEDGTVEKVIYEYEYDENDNWVKRLTFKNGKAKNILEREITYFN